MKPGYVIISPDLPEEHRFKRVPDSTILLPPDWHEDIFDLANANKMCMYV